MRKNHEDDIVDFHPFAGQLITGEAASQWLTSMICESPNGVSICSAFLRSEALHAIYSNEQIVSYGRVLSRWRLSDLISQASDLDSYLLSKRLGLSFFIRQDFHGKVFSVPNKGIIVGSANTTLSGFGLKKFANSEVCTLVPSSEINHSFIDQLFDGAIEITDDLFEEISDFLVTESARGQDQLDWPIDLMSKLSLAEFSGRILLSECFSSVPVLNGNVYYSILDEKDVNLLGLNRNHIELNDLKVAFKSTRIFRWLSHTLKSADGDVYFGSLAAALHSTLLDDPVVYRSDVKNILQILLRWCQLLEIDEIVVDRPNHSQRVRLV